jgi:hypothetical protein
MPGKSPPLLPCLRGMTSSCTFGLYNLRKSTGLLSLDFMFALDLDNHFDYLRLYTIRCDRLANTGSAALGYVCGELRRGSVWSAP